MTKVLVAMAFFYTFIPLCTEPALMDGKT